MKQKPTIFFILFILYTGLFISCIDHLEEPWQAVGKPGFSGGIAVDISFAIDGNDIPYIAFFEDNYSEIKVMKFNGTKWEYIGDTITTYSKNNYLYSKDTPPENEISLAIDCNNIPYIAFLENEKISVKKFNGTSWVYAGNSMFSEERIHTVFLSFNSNNIPYIACDDNNLTIMCLNGSTWEYEGNPLVSEEDANEISLSFDSNDVPYVAYIINGGSLRVKKFKGVEWEYVGNQEIDVVSYDISLAIDTGDMPYVSYNKNRQNAKIQKFNGTSWEYVETMGFSEESAYNLSLTIDSKDIPYIAYSDVEYYYGEISVQKFNGTEWEYVGNPGFNYKRAQYICIAMDSNDIPYVAYNDGGYDGKATVAKYVPEL